MPVPNAAERIYRRLSFGTLIDLTMLDLRSYRSKQADRLDGAIDDPTRTILGAEQRTWLIDGLTTSKARWKLIGNSVMVSPVRIPPLSPELTGALTRMLGLPAEGPALNTDQWD